MRILISGHNGKLGSNIKQALSNKYTIVGHHRHECLTQKIKDTQPDMIIDVTSSISVHTHLPIYLLAQIPTIIGSSGLLPKQALGVVHKAKFPLMIVPNFSPSFQKFAQKAIEIAQTHKVLSISETHHETKIDKPSGSALYLAHALQNTCIHSIRIPQYIAQHTIHFETHPELTHTISSPSEFVSGALTCVESIQIMSNSQIIFPGLGTTQQ